MVTNLNQLSKTLTAIAGNYSEVKVDISTEDKQDTRVSEKTNEKVKEESTVTIEDIRAELAKKSQDGRTQDVKKLLESFGVKKLSSVDPADYVKLYAAAKEL